MKKLTCIDLFCGCGGISLGMLRAGFDVIAAIDFNHEAVETVSKNLRDVRHALQKDLTKFHPSELEKIIGTDDVDVIVGGPPCQGFSVARKRDGANTGPRLIEDDRRHLYQEFLRYVSHFQPKVFVMENVLGIKTAAHGKYFTDVQKEARTIGYRVHPQVERVSELGVPQKRIRQLIIGTRLDLASYFPSKLPLAPRATSSPTLGHAICDLPVIKPGGGEESVEYDMDRRHQYVGKYGRKFLYETAEVAKATALTSHVARPHSERDLRDFARLNEGEHCGRAMKRGEKFEFPYDKDNFKDRYTRQHRDHLCSTIVAHMSKDGLMFIHPTQNRSLTPREAARVQGFPDWFVFPPARTQQYRLIGNAVPPLVGESIGLAVKAYLKKAEQKARSRPDVPTNSDDAARLVASLIAGPHKKSLHLVPADEFRRAWLSIGFLFPQLHPVSALENGRQVSNDAGTNSQLKLIYPRLVAPFYVQSGWPVALERVAREACRRHESNDLHAHDFYCDDAAAAGLIHQNRNKTGRRLRAELR